MMIEALIAYAERENLGDADFERVKVRWAISLDAAGNFAGVIPLSENPDEKKPKPKLFLRPFTPSNQTSSGEVSHFLCDSLERAVLWLDEESASKADRRKTQHEFFKSLLRQAANAVQEESSRLRAVLSFLEDTTAIQLLYGKLVESRAKSIDNVVFLVDGFNLLDSEPLKEFWRERRMSEAGENKTRQICAATGVLTETIGVTEKIKGLPPPALGMGVNLVSNDKPSFCHYGLEQAQNGSISAEAELKMRSALDHLIAKSREQKIFLGSIVPLHWTRKSLPFDPLDPVVSGDSEMFERLLKSVQQGQVPVDFDTNAYYALTVSGNGGRMVVRDWLESTVSQVAANVRRWFNDLAIVGQNGAPVRRNFSLWQLLSTTVMQLGGKADLERLSPQASGETLFAALNGRPLPRIILVAALKRQQLEKDKRNVVRMALIKVCLLRSPNTKENAMTEGLNPENRDPAYLCGRLLAVFDRVQYLALGSVNAGVIEKSYSSAMTMPALVMGRLFRNAQFHISKAGGGIAVNVQKELTEIARHIGDWPTTLTLEEQGRFALGFYHQKDQYYRNAIERKEATEAR